MDIKDVLGAGKVLPMKKLLDVLSNAIGRVTKSYFYKKDADAKAYEIGQLAKANAEGLKIMAAAIQEVEFSGNVELKDGQLALASSGQPPVSDEITELSLVDRGRNRLEYREAKKQLNIESVTAFAAEELNNEKSVTDEPLDEDWTTRFFKIAEDISNEEMQALWGRILAGEIKQPKSFSLRTLDLLRNLSKEEAEIFTKLAMLRIDAGGESFVCEFDERFDNKYRILRHEWSLMAEIGLIFYNEDIMFKYQNDDNSNRSVLFKLGRFGIVASGEFNMVNHLSIIKFTTSGSEIASLITPLEEEAFILLMCNRIGCYSNVSVTYGDLNESEDGIVNPINYNNIEN